MGENNKFPKWAVQTPNDKRAIRKGCWFDFNEAKRIIRFAQTVIVHPSGKRAGKPFKLLGWQKRFLGNLFGWKRPDGTRRFRQAFLFIPRGNGKSTLCAIILWYMMLADNEPEPYCEIAACKKEQAATIFKMAMNMAMVSPQLKKLKIKAKPSQKEIYYPAKRATFKAISNDAPGALGGNDSLLCLDEICAYPNRNLYNSLIDSVDKDRRQSLVLMASTAGHDMSPENIGFEKYHYACGVRDGNIKDISFLPCLYSADQNATVEEIASLAVWKAANPSLGTHMLSINAMKKRHEVATYSAMDMLNFKKYRLNIFVPTSTAAYVPLHIWDNCKGDNLIPEGTKVWLGVDLSSTTDISSLIMLANLNGKYVLNSFNYVPITFQERNKQNLLKYQTFASRGELVITRDERRDDDMIEHQIRDLIDRYAVEKIVFDNYQAHELANRLMDDGHDCVQFSQTISNFNEPTKTLEKLCYKKKIVHGGEEILRWMIQNVAIDASKDGKLIKPMKTSEPQKIDAIIALIQALSEAYIGEETSVYEDRGVLVF